MRYNFSMQQIDFNWKMYEEEMGGFIMTKSRMKLMFLLTMLVSVFMLFGCVKKKTDNTTATVETPTPTPTEVETPEETPTPTPTVTVTATPTPKETVVSAVEVEDTEYDNNRNDDGYTASSGNSGTSGSNNNSNNNNNGNGSSNTGSSALVFSDDYVDRSELSDDQVGYGSGTVPEASGPFSPGEGNQALISASVYVRSGPGRTSEIIGSLREGDVVIVLGNENGWLKINYGDKVGYFYQEYAALDW